MCKGIDGFGSLKRPIPLMCSVLNGSDAEPILNYGISLEGIYIIILIILKRLIYQNCSFKKN